MGGDALNAPQTEYPVPDGTIAVLTAAATPGPEDEAARAAFASRDMIAEGLRIPAYAAAEIIGAAATRMGYGETSLNELLSQKTFSTALGPVTFEPNGERREPGFVLAILDDGNFRRLSLEDAAALAGENQ
jgi:branched-chain amino acid transport system substrate-binding protein